MAIFCAGILVGVALGIFLTALLHDDDTTRGHPL